MLLITSKKYEGERGGKKKRNLTKKNFRIKKWKPSQDENVDSGSTMKSHVFIIERERKRER